MEEAIFDEVQGTYIGIDLGTSNSVVSYFKDGQIEQVKFRNQKMIPSALYFESKDKVIFGDRALNKGIVNTEFLIKEFKRDLGSKTKYTINFPSSEKFEEKESIFIIDTNLFIDEPLILDTFSKSDSIKIGLTVISELQNLANQDNVKVSAEMALENITKMKLELDISDEESRLDLLPEDMTANTPNDDNDNRVLSITKFFTNENPEKEVILLTNDNGLKVKAESIGVGVLNYKDFSSYKSQLEQQSNGETITITPKEASRKLLAYLKELSEKVIGNDVQKAVITVPANFNPTQIGLVKEAGEEAGFSEISIIKEPVAVGFAYAMEEDGNKTILIYDFGGGTFDSSFLKIANETIEVIETDGDNKLGGKNITDKVMEIIFEKIEDDFQLDMFDQVDSGLSLEDFNSNNSAIWKEAEKSKIELSESDSIEVAISNLINSDGNSFNLKFDLTKSKFETEISDIRKKSLDIIKDIINSSGINVSEIDEIVMAGGTSAIPSLRQSIVDTFGKEPKKSIDTAIVISQGALLQADRLWNPKERVKEQVTYNDFSLQDFGIGIENHTFDLIIPKGTALPFSETREYSTEKDNQEVISIQAFQRKSTKSSSKKTYDKGINFIDEIRIEGIPPSRVGELTIKVTFELTKDDILDVSVEILDINGNSQHHEKLEISKASKDV